jgi:hypothetical protein
MSKIGLFTFIFGYKKAPLALARRAIEIKDALVFIH